MRLFRHKLQEIVVVIHCAPFDDIGYRAGKHLQSLRQLQSHHLRVVLPYVVNCLVDFKRVISGKLLDGCVQLGIG